MEPSYRLPINLPPPSIPLHKGEGVVNVEHPYAIALPLSGGAWGGGAAPRTMKMKG
jgi:hypothetical protein